MFSLEMLILNIVVFGGLILLGKGIEKFYQVIIDNYDEIILLIKK